MRGLLATISLIVAIGGLLVVIGYGASTAYLEYRDEDADLYSTLLMGSAAPVGWTSERTPSVNYQEQFVTPCLQTPLLEGVGVSGRGAATYLPPAGQSGIVQAFLLQTSDANARAIMADLDRDTENNCQRGVTVGTVESATVEAVEAGPVDEALLVTSNRLVDDELVVSASLVFRNGQFLGRVGVDDAELAQDLVPLSTALATRIETPPTDAELEAAGVLEDPSRIDELSTQVKDETERLLSAQDRLPVEAGFGVLGIAVLLMYVFGARLSRTPDAEAPPRSRLSMMPTNPTLDSYGVEGHERPKIYSPALSLGNPDDEAEDDDFESSVGNDLADVSISPSPIINFPQKPIEEKLKILKEARLREPKREHRAVRDVTPDVDWTEEISKAQSKSKLPANARPEQISRKALLKKLRSNQTDQ